MTIAGMVIAPGILKSGIVAGTAFGVGGILYVLLFLRELFVITAKGRRYLVSRVDLSDELRILLLAGLYTGLAFVGVVLFFGLLVVLRFLQGY